MVGAKQNRILNLSILAPAHKTIVVPVSCVEAGRWHAQSAEFGSAKRANYAAGRAQKASQVSASLSSTGTRRSDQSRVWADISAKSARMQSFSATEAAAKAEIERFDAIGLGEDLRLRAPHVAGGALLTEGRIVHLCAFRVSAGESAEHGPSRSRLARASQRRRGRL